MKAGPPVLHAAYPRTLRQGYHFGVEGRRSYEPIRLIVSPGHVARRQRLALSY